MPMKFSLKPSVQDDHLADPEWTDKAEPKLGKELLTVEGKETPC